MIIKASPRIQENAISVFEWQLDLIHFRKCFFFLWQVSLGSKGIIYKTKKYAKYLINIIP